MSQDTLRIIYFSYFHSILLYGIILWGNSAYSPNIFKIQKRIIRVIMNAKNRDSCCQLFKKLKILPLKSQYTFSLLLFVAKNRDLYKQNSEIHDNNIRFSSNLHTPTANLKKLQKGPFYFGIKVFNHLPTSIKNISHDIRQFQYVLKCFLLINSFTQWRNIVLGIRIEILVQCNNFKSKHLNNLSCNVSQYCFTVLLLM